MNLFYKYLNNFCKFTLAYSNIIVGYNNIIVFFFTADHLDCRGEMGETLVFSNCACSARLSECDKHGAR